VVPVEETLLSVVEMLAKNKLCIAPVSAKTKQGEDENGIEQFVGIVGLMDIAAWLLSKVSKSMEMNHILNFCREECQRPTVGDLLTSDKSGRTSWHSISSNSTLSELLDVFSQPQVHRVAVMDSKIFAGEGKENSVISILNVLHVAGYLNAHWKEVSSHLGERKVADLSPDEAEAFSQDDISHLVSAFRTTWHRQSAGDLHSHGVSFADKFINWIVQITLADISPPECGAFIHSEDSLETALSYMSQQQVQQACISTGDENNQIVGSIHLRSLFKEIATSHRNSRRESIATTKPSFQLPPRRH